MKSEIEEFCKQVKSGIILKIEDPNVLEKIGEDIFKVEEGIWGRRALSISQSIEAADESCELYTLAKEAAETCDCEIFTKKELNLLNQPYNLRKKLIALFELPEYSTNQEILEEIKFKLGN